MSGFGLETTMHAPCPFCAAPDFAIFKILETQAVLSQEHTCAECGRSTRTIFSQLPGQVSFEIVQTGGVDPPDFMSGIRRVSLVADEPSVS